MTVGGRWRVGLRTLALGYLALLLLAPVALVAWRSLEHGPGALWQSLTTPTALSALELTLLIAAIAVPLNTAVGILGALALVRGRFPGRRLLDALVDVPFVVSPVIVGLSLVLIFGRRGWLGDWLAEHGIRVIFAPAGMVLATMFVSLPFVMREVAPVLREIGTEQEEAAATLGATPWQAFRRVTLPAIRPAVTYGVVLTTARAIGEFGAVSVVSGRVAGETLTLPLLVQQRFEGFDVSGAYAASFLLAAIALLTLLAITLLRPRARSAA